MWCSAELAWRRSFLNRFVWCSAEERMLRRQATNHGHTCCGGARQSWLQRIAHLPRSQKLNLLGSLCCVLILHCAEVFLIGLCGAAQSSECFGGKLRSSRTWRRSFLNRFVWCSARAAKASAASHVGCEAIAARAASTAIVELRLLRG